LKLQHQSKTGRMPTVDEKLDAVLAGNARAADMRATVVRWATENEQRASRTDRAQILAKLATLQAPQTRQGRLP
jgi:hypothetical protein